MLLVDDLLLLPFKGFLGIFKKIHEMADREVSDEAYLQGRLLELQLLYEMDEIGEEEYSQQATDLEARLNAIREAEAGGESPGEVGPRDSKAAA